MKGSKGDSGGNRGGKNDSDGKEDIRQQRSKQRLSEGLLHLMNQQPFREISVVDICRAASVHRTTFYAHFEDKNDLFRYILSQLKETFEKEQAELTSQGGLTTYLLALFCSVLRFLKKHRQLYLSGLFGGGPELRIMEDVIAESLERGIQEDREFSAAFPSIEAASRFYAGAVLAVVRWWLETGMSMREETLVRQIRQLLPRISEE